MVGLTEYSFMFVCSIESTAAGCLHCYSDVNTFKTNYLFMLQVGQWYRGVSMGQLISIATGMSTKKDSDYRKQNSGSATSESIS